MKITQNLKSAVSTFIYKVWHSPKGKLSAKVKDACEGIPEKKRLKVVTAMLAVFVLVAFFVFGHACYKMGAGHARQTLKVEHLKMLDLPSQETDLDEVPTSQEALQSMDTEADSSTNYILPYEID